MAKLVGHQSSLGLLVPVTVIGKPASACHRPWQLLWLEWSCRYSIFSIGTAPNCCIIIIKPKPEIQILSDY